METTDVGIGVEQEFNQIESEIAHRASAAFLKHLRKTVANQDKTGLIVAPGVVDLRGDPQAERVRLESRLGDWLLSRFSAKYLPQRHNNGIITTVEIDDEHKKRLERILKVKVVDSPPKDDDLIIAWKNEPDYVDLPHKDLSENNENLDQSISQLKEFSVYHYYLSSDELAKMPQRLVDIIRKVSSEGRIEQPEGYYLGDLFRDIIKQIAEGKLNNRAKLDSNSST